MAWLAKPRMRNPKTFRCFPRVLMAAGYGGGSGLGPWHRCPMVPMFEDDRSKSAWNMGMGCNCDPQTSFWSFCQDRCDFWCNNISWKMSQDGVRKDINVNRPCRGATSQFGNKESMIDPWLNTAFAPHDLTTKHRYSVSENQMRLLIAFSWSSLTSPKLKPSILHHGRRVNGSLGSRFCGFGFWDYLNLGWFATGQNPPPVYLHLIYIYIYIYKYVYNIYI